MERIGGLYVFKDGVRILPYGDVNNDWLGIEYRRTKSAYYYYFSYRKLFGLIQVSSATNCELKEKAGREGFQENMAFRQLKDVLEKFFVQLAADFFRKEGPRAEYFNKRKEELVRLTEAEKKRKELVKTKKEELAKQLEAFFQHQDSGIIADNASKLSDKFKKRLENARHIVDKEAKSKELISIERESTAELRSFIEQYKIVKPRIALSKGLSKEWEDYLGAYVGLEMKIIAPIRAFVDTEVSGIAKELRETLSRRVRINESLKDLGETAVSVIKQEDKKTMEVLGRITSETKEIIKDSVTAVDKELRDVVSDFNRIDIEGLSEDEIVKQRMSFENRINESRQQYEELLATIREQLEAISFDGTSITQVDQMEAIEQKMVVLEEQADADLQLTQLGMAVEVINHEFSASIRSVRNRLQELKAWSDVNEKIQPIYTNLRASFDHLDGYLTLFTPLHRRLQRSKSNFEGADITKYINDLFEERLKKEGVVLTDSREFRKKKIFEYPSSIYPVFINLVDNAIFWLKTHKTAERKIEFLTDGEDILVRDNGPGVSLRDAESIFEMGFTRKPGGRGLGLPISRSVLRGIQYELTLDSPENGSGATFRISKRKESADE